MSWLNIAIANEENANQTWFPQFSLGRTPRTAKGPIVLALIWPMRTDRLCQCKGLRSVDNQHPQTRAGVFSSSAFNARSFGCRFLCPPSHGNASCLSDSVWAWLLTLLRVGGQICPRYHICWTARSIARIEVLFPSLQKRIFSFFFFFRGPQLCPNRPRNTKF